MKKILIGAISIVFLILVGLFFYNLIAGKNQETDIESIKADVESGSYDYKKGVDALQKRNYPVAEACFLKVLSQQNLNKENKVNTLYNLGVTYAEQSKFDKAKLYWGQAANMGDTASADELHKLK